MDKKTLIRNTNQTSKSSCYESEHKLPLSKDLYNTCLYRE